MENQLINAVGFDFMIEHPYNHYTDIFKYFVAQGEARESGPLRVPCRHELGDYGFTPRLCISKSVSSHIIFDRIVRGKTKIPS